MSTRREETDRLAGQVLHVSREEFLTDYWTYRPGEHVSVFAPTGGGKTQWSMQLLGDTASEKLQAVILVMKQRDATVTKFAKLHDFKVIRSWPPPPRLPYAKQPAGYVLWPPGNKDARIEQATQARVFRPAMQDLYWRNKPHIVFADEGYSLEKELGLSDEINRMLTKGRGMETGLWMATQRPAWISAWAYQAHHLFIGNDPDDRARKRYSEISSGVDPDLIRTVTARLGQYEYLYLHRDSRTMCIVGAS